MERPPLHPDACLYLRVRHRRPKVRRSELAQEAETRNSRPYRARPLFPSRADSVQFSVGPYPESPASFDRLVGASNRGAQLHNREATQDDGRIFWFM
jgi:hypothetical protein